jgi:hypothetical protein
MDTNTPKNFGGTNSTSRVVFDVFLPGLEEGFSYVNFFLLTRQFLFDGFLIGFE